MFSAHFVFPFIRDMNFCSEFPEAMENRARGALFSTPRRVVCENNLFDHPHGTAILLCGDCNGWYETGACKEVTIRNNTFVNALAGSYQFTNAVISIYPEIPDLDGQEHLFHSGIVVEDNLFEIFDHPLLYAKSTDGIIFRNNKVNSCSDTPPPKRRFGGSRHTDEFVTPPRSSSSIVSVNAVDRKSVV